MCAYFYVWVANNAHVCLMPDSEKRKKKQKPGWSRGLRSVAAFLVLINRALSPSFCLLSFLSPFSLLSMISPLFFAAFTGWIIETNWVVWPCLLLVGRQGSGTQFFISCFLGSSYKHFLIHRSFSISISISLLLACTCTHFTHHCTSSQQWGKRIILASMFENVSPPVPLLRSPSPAFHLLRGVVQVIFLLTILCWCMCFVLLLYFTVYKHTVLRLDNHPFFPPCVPCSL